MLQGHKDILHQTTEWVPIGLLRVLVRWETAVVGLIIVIFIGHTIYLNVPAEDAYITFRFARNLVNSGEIVWNIGESPVEGYTNFSWLLLSALAIKLNLDVVLYTQLIGVLASLLTLLFVYRFSRRIMGFPAGIALIPCLLLSLSGPFATWASSSMETNLFTLLVLLGCYYFAGWVRSKDIRQLLLAQGMLLLSALTRPEGFLVFAILAGLAFLFSLGSGNKAPLWKVLGALLVFIIPFGLYFFWRYRYFGYPLPNTFYAKTGGGLAQYIRGAKYSILFGLLYLVPLAPVLLTLLWECGLKGFLTIPKTFLMLMSELEKHIGLVVCSLVSLVYTFYIIYVGGDYMAMFRFFVPLLPLLYLIFGLLTFWLYQEIARNPYKLGITNWLIIFAGALTLLQSTPLEQAIFGKPWFMHGTYRGVQHERWHVARNTLVGKFFRGYISDEDESLAVLGIGIIPFMNDITIHSFHGIVDPYIAHLKTGKPIGEGIPGHEKVDYVSVILKKPTYIMVDTGDLYPELQPFPDYPDEVDAFVRENYELKGAWLDDRVNQEEGYLMFLELKEP